MQKYLNYVSVYTLDNIYQDLLVFNYHEHFIMKIQFILCIQFMTGSNFDPHPLYGAYV